MKNRSKSSSNKGSKQISDVNGVTSLSSADVTALIEGALNADYTLVRRIGSTLVKHYSETGEEDAARRLTSILRKKGVPLKASGNLQQLPVDGKTRSPLIEEQLYPDTPIFLEDTNKPVIENFIADVKSIDTLIKNGISSHLCLMLSGPPGTGKSLLAGHIAGQLGRPFYVVRLDALISSMLGDTAKNIREIFEFVPPQGGVLFLDEIDAIAKMRGDKHELGELKRVVNTLIQGLDSIDPHTVVIGATNHPDLLDPAIWRRFPYQIALEMPNEEVRREMWSHFLFNDKDEDKDAHLLAQISKGLSGANIREIAMAARRIALLNNTDVHLGPITWAILEIRNDRGFSLPSKMLTADEKKKLISELLDKFSLNQSQAGLLTDVARQQVSYIVKHKEQ